MRPSTSRSALPRQTSTRPVPASAVATATSTTSGTGCISASQPGQRRPTVDRRPQAPAAPALGLVAVGDEQQVDPAGAERGERGPEAGHRPAARRQGRSQAGDACSFVVALDPPLGFDGGGPDLIGRRRHLQADLAGDPRPQVRVQAVLEVGSDLRRPADHEAIERPALEDLEGERPPTAAGAAAPARRAGCRPAS